MPRLRPSEEGGVVVPTILAPRMECPRLSAAERLIEFYGSAATAFSNWSSFLSSEIGQTLDDEEREEFFETGRDLVRLAQSRIAAAQIKAAFAAGGASL